PLSGPRVVMGVTVLVLDDHRPVVRAHARLGEGKRGRAKGALRRHPADDPVGPAAAWAVIDFVLAIDSVIAPLIRLPRLAGGDRPRGDRPGGNRHCRPS